MKEASVLKACFNENQKHLSTAAHHAVHPLAVHGVTQPEPRIVGLGEVRLVAHDRVRPLVSLVGPAPQPARLRQPLP